MDGAYVKVPFGRLPNGTIWMITTPYRSGAGLTKLLRLPTRGAFRKKGSIKMTEDDLFTAATIMHETHVLLLRLDHGDPLALDLDGTLRFVLPAALKTLAPVVEQHGREVVESSVVQIVREWLGYA